MHALGLLVWCVVHVLLRRKSLGEILSCSAALHNLYCVLVVLAVLQRMHMPLKPLTVFVYSSARLFCGRVYYQGHLVLQTPLCESEDRAWDVAYEMLLRQGAANIRA